MSNNSIPIMINEIRLNEKEIKRAKRYIIGMGINTGKLIELDGDLIAIWRDDNNLYRFYKVNPPPKITEILFH